MDKNNHSINTISDWFIYVLVRLFIFLFSMFPKSWMYFFIKYISLNFYHLSKRRRLITTNNLKYAFPKKNEEEIHILARDVFVDLSQTIAEIIMMLTNRFDIDKAIINKSEVIEKLKELKKQYPQGWIMLTAHFSNWELLPHFLAKHGYPMLAIGREGDNVLIDKNITIPFRQMYGNKAIHKKRAAVAVLKALKKHHNIGILVDQKVHESEGVKVKFFEREVYSTALVAVMKNKLDIAVLPIFITRVTVGKYEIIIKNPAEQKGDILTMTQSYNDLMQSMIEQYPSQWLWMHNRWKM